MPIHPPINRSAPSPLVLHLIGLFLLICRTECAATVIIIAYNEENICVAADSRIRKGGVVSDNNCKILQSGRWFLIRAGWFETVPNGKSITDRIIAGTNSIKDARDSLRDLSPVIAKEFTYLLEVNKKDYPETYKEIVSRKTDELAHVGICGFLDGKPLVELTYWKLRFKPDGSPFVTTETEAKPLATPDRLGYEVIGQNGAIKKALEENQNLVVEYRDDLATFARYLTAQELASKPPFDQTQYVGGAIDIVQIREDRAEWLQRKKECADLVQWSK
jgi:hypothetical protein